MTEKKGRKNMGRTFHHFTWDERIRLEEKLKAGKSIPLIAKELGFSRATIYNELKRGKYERLNSDWTTEIRYSPEIAERNYRQNMTGKGADLKIGNDHRLATYIEKRILEDKYSPGAVVAEIKNLGLPFSVTLSRWTIYKYIEKGIFLHLTMKDLPGKSRKKKAKRRKVGTRPPIGDSIEARPSEIEDRNSFGHWEMDTVVGTHGCKKVFLVLTERLTRKEYILLLRDKTAESVVRALNRLKKAFGERFSEVFKTITVDNGSEFSDTEGMEYVPFGGKHTKIFYCHPYSAWERGSNERANWLIRRWFPKKTSFAEVTEADVQRVEKWMNNYPRVILGGKTPEMLFQEQISMLFPVA